MTDEQTALSRRAVACRGFRWVPGMLTLDGFRLSPVDADGDDPPDLTDPATLGCLLALVREAWGMPTGITVSYSSDGGLWGVSWSGATHVGWCGRGVTEAEALVAALESVP